MLDILSNKRVQLFSRWGPKVNGSKQTKMFENFYSVLMLGNVMSSQYGVS